jgi:hypothetical protein
MKIPYLFRRISVSSVVRGLTGLTAPWNSGCPATIQQHEDQENFQFAVLTFAYQGIQVDNRVQNPSCLDNLKIASIHTILFADPLSFSPSSYINYQREWCSLQREMLLEMLPND